MRIGRYTLPGERSVDIFESTYHRMFVGLILGIASFLCVFHFFQESFQARSFAALVCLGFLGYFVILGLGLSLRLARFGGGMQEFLTYVQARPLVRFSEFCLFCFLVYKVLQAVFTK